MSVPIDHNIVGTCGNCGGPVTVPQKWMGVTKPPKTCQRCGAAARENYGPAIPMGPSTHKLK